ncbi:CAF17-like 4Fe-4S cluster assembly/insertion protein YgfZ [Magnetococcales bacterium HHB-1]
MSLLYDSLKHAFSWSDDHGEKTPTLFSDPSKEQQALAEQCALVDFSHMGLVEISGEERQTFLSGLITNQIRKVTANQAIHTAFLSPQGRFLWDFTIIEHQDRYFLATEPGVVMDIGQRLMMYILRSQVKLRNASQDYAILGIVGPQAGATLGRFHPELDLSEAQEGDCFIPLLDGQDQGLKLWCDPRHKDYGWRLLVPKAHFDQIWQALFEEITPAGLTAWTHHRIDKALPRGGEDLIHDKTLPLEAGFLDLNCVDFQKGCYIGQETTTRTHHRGTIKKRLYKITLPGKTSASLGDAVLTSSGKEVGIISSLSIQEPQSVALGLLRVSDCEEALTVAGEAVQVEKPGWVTSW